MLTKNVLRWLSLFLLLVFMVLLASPFPAKADGGAAAPYEIWVNLKEGQQIAVITLKNEDTAKIDLFISILDATGKSHEVTFFLPLGTGAADFSVVEQRIHIFNEQTTAQLDSILHSNAFNKNLALNELFAGTLLANGVLLVPLWAPLLLSGCSAVQPKPEATFQTESSQISIYGIDENTDLEALVKTTGLDSSVQEVLSRLRGQQIAVVKLRTQPQAKGASASTEGSEADEPGIHLAWTASLVSSESGNTYSYPLGTGASWSKPIELTRVYIVAPPGRDFDVSYPAIGSDESGYKYGTQARIAEYYQKPAYAVDEARGSFGRVWRATYTQSNSTEDIVIITRPQTALSQLYAGIQANAVILALIFALVFGLAFWVLAWHFLMPRLIGKGHDPKNRLRWYYSLIYPAINLALIVIPGLVLFLLFTLGLAIQSLAVLFLLFGGISILAFMLVHARHLDVSRGKALAAFVGVTLASNGCYLILALALAKLIGII
ncbi:MAG: hypothetical protein NTW48_05095 [Chloroflexi bacterium]|nr:hypothetical protein [Chloroflexota bacterium]